MTRNDLTNRLLNAAIVASIVLAVALYAYYDWQPADPGPPETEMLVPGPVAPEQVWQDTWSGCSADKCYFCWNVGEDNQECIEYGTIGIGPVEPQPKVENHVAAVMDDNRVWSTDDPGSGTIDDTTALHLYLIDLPPRDDEGYFYAKCRDNVYQYVDPPSCPTYDALKRAGIEIVCTNAFGEVPSVNYWPVDMPMACTKIKEVRITNDKIKVTGGKR